MENDLPDSLLSEYAFEHSDRPHIYLHAFEVFSNSGQPVDVLSRDFVGSRATGKICIGGKHSQDAPINISFDALQWSVQVRSLSILCSSTGF
jgi:hypothetical protein